jgi:hypothetical protein
VAFHKSRKPGNVTRYDSIRALNTTCTTNSMDLGNDRNVSIDSNIGTHIAQTARLIIDTLCGASSGLNIPLDPSTRKSTTPLARGPIRSPRARLISRPNPDQTQPCSRACKSIAGTSSKLHRLAHRRSSFRPTHPPRTRP